MRILLFLVLFFSVWNPSFGQDSVSPQEMQVKLLEQQVNQLQEEINNQEERIRDLQATHREDMDKRLQSKIDEINGRMAIYAGAFVVFISILVYLANWLGKRELRNTVNKLAGQQIDNYIQQKLSDSVIDKNLSKHAKPVVDNLLGKYEPALSKLLENTQEQYDKYQRLLQENSKNLLEPRVDGESVQDGKLSEFVNALEQVKDEKEYSAIDWYLKGNLEVEKGNFNEAIAYYNKAIKLDSEDDSTYNNRGYAKTNLGKYEEALEDYNKAIELDSNSSDAYNNRGFTKINLKMYEEARVDFEQAISINKFLANSHKHLAYIHFQLGQFQEALKEVNEAIELKRNYKEAIELKEEIIKRIEEANK